MIYNKSTDKNIPKSAVYIGRGSKWGNPFKIGIHGTRKEVIAKYKLFLLAKPELLNQVEELKNKDLVCYCKPLDCHGDILEKIANNDLHLQ